MSRAAALAVVLLLAACSRDPQEVVVYCALERKIAEPALQLFERTSGVRVRADYAAARAGAPGLVERIVRERARPRCDVFWGDGPLDAIRLEEQGLLEPYVPDEEVGGPPAGLDDADHHWHGFAARARVLLVNTERLPSRAQWPTSVDDLLAERFRGMAAIAAPDAGTARAHAAVLAATLGPAGAARLFDPQGPNEVRVVADDAQAVRLVRDGEVAFALVGSDAAQPLVRSRTPPHPLAIVHPDAEGAGTLLLPTTVAILRGGPNPKPARRLVDFLLSDKSERLLAFSEAGLVPIRHEVDKPETVPSLTAVKVMQVDWTAALKAEIKEPSSD